mmetsp:Transcript_20776/g.52671  ORF Transcript_20776/g.52671 Transcript_20776/m.52671 type:complete len:581 (-) Transcript_20776:53-1795(-)
MRASAAAAIAALAALVAAAPGETQAVSLRQAALATLTASGGASKLNCMEDEQRKAYRRKGGPRKLQDRFCERSNKVAETCTCNEVCNVWGHPFVAPFWSKCAVNVVNEPGSYPVWYLPPTKGRDEVNITAAVDPAESGGFAVTGLYVNDDLVMLAEDCVDSLTGSPTEYVATDIISLKSDNLLARKPKAEDDVSVIWKSLCTWKNSRWQLNVTVIIKDNGATKSTAMDSTVPDDVATIPSSTIMFAKDSGLCVDPRDYINGARRLICGRVSDSKAGLDMDARECSCSSQCAAYGKPWVYDLFAKHPKNGGKDECSSKNKECFALPAGDNVESRQDQVLYNFKNRFAAEAVMDECKHISAVRLYFLRKRDRVARCNRGFQPESITSYEDPEDLAMDEISAAEVCVNEEDFDFTDRKRLLIPSETMRTRFFSPDLNGYDLGLFARMDDGDLLEIPRDKDVKECLNPNRVTELIDFGGVQVILKCHRLVTGTPYFNVCVERNGVRRAEYRADMDTTKRLHIDRLLLQVDPESVEGADRRTLLAVEAAAQSGGHCAVGEALKTGGYTYRESSAVHSFQFPQADS